MENTKKYKDIIICVLSALCCAMVFFIIFNNKTSQNASKEANIKSIDTVVVRDTLRIEVPVEKIKYKEITKVESVYVEVPVTQEKIPFEQKQYTDSIADIYISGFQPSLDSIHYHIPKQTIYVDRTIEIEKPKSFWQDRFIFTVGVYGGYGIINKKPDIFIGAGVGIRLGK